MPAVRSLARFAGAALMLTSAVVGATATTSFASAESTTAVLTSPLSGTSTVFTWDYAFHQNGGHALSNVAIAFCSADVLGDVVSATPSGAAFPGGVTGGHDGFGAGVKFGVTAPTGTVTVTFTHPHPIVAGALQIQSHSGDGDTGDAITTAAGPGPCPAEWDPTTTSSTTSTTVQGDDSEDPPTTTPSTLIAVDPKPEGHGTTTTTTTGGVTAVNPTTTTTAPAGTTTTTTAPRPTTTTIPTEVEGINKTGGDPQTTVLGETVERPAPAAPAGAPGSMARTGIGHFMFLMVLALSLFGAGLALLVAARRRRHTTTG